MRRFNSSVWMVFVLIMLQFLAGCGGESDTAAPPKDATRDATKEAIGEIPGINLAGLSGEERALTLKIMNEYVCNHGCAKDMTIAQAQAKNKDCLISKRLAEIVIENVKAGKAATMEEQITRIARGADYAASPPPEEIYSVAVGDAPTRGAKDAPVTILIYSDFQ